MLLMPFTYAVEAISTISGGLKMNNESETNKSTTGSFEVYVDGKGPLKQDFISFDVKEESVEFSVLEGVGGAMAPRYNLQFAFLGNDITGKHDVTSLLKVDFADWSADYSYRYKAKSGWIEVKLTQSPHRIVGRYEMVVDIYENSPPGGAPLVRKVTGTFDLTKD